jgi:hypothetical protein
MVSMRLVIMRSLVHVISMSRGWFACMGWTVGWSWEQGILARAVPIGLCWFYVNELC